MYVAGLNVLESILDDIGIAWRLRHFLQDLAWYVVPLDVSPNLVVGNYREQAVMGIQSLDIFLKMRIIEGHQRGRSCVFCLQITRPESGVDRHHASVDRRLVARNCGVPYPPRVLARWGLLRPQATRRFRNGVRHLPNHYCIVSRREQLSAAPEKLLLRVDIILAAPRDQPSSFCLHSMCRLAGPILPSSSLLVQLTIELQPRRFTITPGQHQLRAPC